MTSPKKLDELTTARLAKLVAQREHQALVLSNAQASIAALNGRIEGLVRGAGLDPQRHSVYIRDEPGQDAAGARVEAGNVIDEQTRQLVNAPEEPT